MKSIGIFNLLVSVEDLLICVFSFPVEAVCRVNDIGLLETENPCREAASGAFSVIRTL